jgi:hypothetical protein
MWDEVRTSSVSEKSCSSLPSVLCLIESELRSIFLPLRFKPARQTVRWKKRKEKQRTALQRRGAGAPWVRVA